MDKSRLVYRKKKYYRNIAYISCLSGMRMLGKAGTTPSTPSKGSTNDFLFAILLLLLGAVVFFFLAEGGFFVAFDLLLPARPPWEFLMASLILRFVLLPLTP